METKAKVKVISEPTKRNILIECPKCKHPNYITLSIKSPPSKGRMDCHNCGATLEYEEILIEPIVDKVTDSVL